LLRIKLEQQQYVVDSVWNGATTAEQRIAEIEGRINPNVIEVIQTSFRTLIFPTTNAFIRQHKIGVIESSLDAAKLRGIKVRILMPLMINRSQHRVH
jgi:two-component system, OmpR family, sensor histidine kinase VicK